MSYKLTVDTYGNILSQYRSPEPLPVHGSVVDGVLCLESTEALDMHLRHWDGNAWATRDPAPDASHVWNGSAWVFNSDRDIAVRSLVMLSIRNRRSSLLTACDWTQITDSPLTTAEKAEWVTYRQALRDIPEDYSSATSLDDVVWPTKP